jgi:hypothetical protein
MLRIARMGGFERQMFCHLLSRPAWARITDCTCFWILLADLLHGHVHCQCKAIQCNAGLFATMYYTIRIAFHASLLG